MAIKVGDKIPSMKLNKLGPNGMTQVATDILKARPSTYVWIAGRFYADMLGASAPSGQDEQRP